MRIIQRILTQSSDCLLLVRPDGATLHLPCRRQPKVLSGDGAHLCDYLAPESRICADILLRSALRDDCGHSATVKAALQGDKNPAWVEVRAIRLDTDRREPVLLLTWQSAGALFRSGDGIVELLERERRQIGQDLHDNLCQELLSLAFAAGNLSRQLLDRDLEQPAGQAGDLAVVLQRLLGQTRGLARGIATTPIGQEEFVPALRRLAGETSSRFGIHCAVLCHHSPPLATDAAGQLYRIAQEAIANATRHGRASSIHLILERVAGAFRFSIRDNGSGFRVPENDSQAGIGLRGMAYRASHIGAVLTVESHPGTGTLITCELPSGV